MNQHTDQMVYLDTNAFIKVFRDEKGSEIVRQILSSMKHPVVISQLTLVEFINVILRLYRSKYLRRKQVHLVLNKLFKYCFGPSSNRIVKVIPMENKAYSMANGILLKNGFKNSIGSYDSIHIAMVSLFSKSSQKSLVITSDKPFINVCKSEKIDHFNPESCLGCCTKVLF